jgi:hypothetical protein
MEGLEENEMKFVETGLRPVFLQFRHPERSEGSS